MLDYQGPFQSLQTMKNVWLIQKVKVINIFQNILLMLLLYRCWFDEANYFMYFDPGKSAISHKNQLGDWARLY